MFNFIKISSVQVFWQFCKTFYSLTCFKKQNLIICFKSWPPSYGWNISIHLKQQTIKNFPLDRMLNGAPYQGLALNKLFLLRFSKSKSARGPRALTVIRDSTINYYQRGSYLHIYRPIIEYITRGQWVTLLSWKTVQINTQWWYHHVDQEEKTLKSIKMIKLNFLFLVLVFSLFRNFSAWKWMWPFLLTIVQCKSFLLKKELCQVWNKLAVWFWKRFL